MSDEKIRVKIAESYSEYGFDGRMEKRWTWELEAKPTTPVDNATTVVLIEKYVELDSKIDRVAEESEHRWVIAGSDLISLIRKHGSHVPPA